MLNFECKIAHNPPNFRAPFCLIYARFFDGEAEKEVWNKDCTKWDAGICKKSCKFATEIQTI